jgi:thioredoxin-dependent peroxiredoxin
MWYLHKDFKVIFKVLTLRIISMAQNVALPLRKAAPSFSLPDESGVVRTLDEFRGRKLIIFFYPKDDTPGCTQESCDFRDRSSELKGLGFEVIGISPDSVESHKTFKDKYNFEFPLLADVEKTAALAYEVYKERSLYGKKSMGIERSTFVISAEGMLLAEYRGVKATGHVERLLKELSNQ